MYSITVYPEGGIEILLGLGYKVVRFEIKPNEYCYWAFNEFNPADDKAGQGYHYVTGRDVTRYIEQITVAQGIPENKKTQMLQELQKMNVQTRQLDKQHKWIQYLV